MNCKQGDLAFIVKSISGNEGKIVRCAVFLGNYYFKANFVSSLAWGVVAEGLNLPNYTAENHEWCRKRGFDAVFSDSALRPIRDSDGQDETLTWAGKPKEVIHESSTSC